MLERLFKLREHGTTPRAELRGGVVTFLAMAYVIFVQPGVLSGAGMDFGAVMVATCVSAAAATADYLPGRIDNRLNAVIRSVPT